MEALCALATLCSEERVIAWVNVNEGFMVGAGGQVDGFLELSSCACLAEASSNFTNAPQLLARAIICHMHSTMRSFACEFQLFRRTSDEQLIRRKIAVWEKSIDLAKHERISPLWEQKSKRSNLLQTITCLQPLHVSMLQSVCKAPSSLHLYIHSNPEPLESFCKPKVHRRKTTTRIARILMISSPPRACFMKDMQRD